MNIFIDTAVTGCNIVLFDGDHILAMHQEPIERGHAEIVLPLYQSLMQQVNKSSEDIDNVFVTVGPGSFTGLRVGLTVARFIGFSLGVPVHGVDTFQCFSAGSASDQDRLVLIETKRSDYYVQKLNARHQPLSEAQGLSAKEILSDPRFLDSDEMILTGDAVERFIAETSLKDRKIFPQAMFDLKKVTQALQGGILSLSQPDPFYIREADVSQPKKIIRA